MLRKHILHFYFCQFLQIKLRYWQWGRLFEFRLMVSQIWSVLRIQIKTPSRFISSSDNQILLKYVLGYTLTLICQELSHLTNLKFLPRLLLVQKHTFRILTGPPSPVNCASGPGSVSFFFGAGTFQERVSPDITSYIVRAVLASSHQSHPLKNRQNKNKDVSYECCWFSRWKSS